MYKLITVLLSLVAGMVLGWYAHEHWGVAALKQAVPELPGVAPPLDSRQPASDNGPVKTGHSDSVSVLLERNAYAAAVERYESSQSLADTAGMQQARDAILLHAQQRVKSRDYAAAARLLQRFLLASYRDVDARLLLADAFYGQQDYQAAIEQLYEARGYAFRPEMLTRITRRIRYVVNEQAEQFSKDENTTGLLELFQELTQREPDYAAYFIELANAQLALEDRDAAQRSLALVINDPDVGEQAQAMLAMLQQTATAMQESDPVSVAAEVAGVPLIRRGQHFLVDVIPAGAGSLRLLIDTGASMTIVTAAALQQRGLRARDTGRSQVFNTANGQVRAPVYILESLSVGDWYVQQLEVGVLDLGEQAGIDGLLGMNFLSHFRFFIDQNESMLRLSLN
jgi:clan AA aspartic protease (TIGR02281 family)